VVILPEDQRQEIKKVLHKRKDINVTATKRDNVEINCKEAEKGKAILAYAKLKKVVFDEIYAIGDNENDLSQFQVATKAVVMENAEDEIKTYGDIITKSNNENGVAYAMKELLKLF
jgi:hydroxymethylpyrimidine pyrophosphatase-like HAD family hydrolase